MQITPRVHMLTIPFTVPLPTGPVPRSANIFLIVGERITLIDSGVSGAEERIFTCIRELGRRPEEIATLILTHAHPDHIGAARAVRAATGCAVLASAVERRWIEDTEAQRKERPVPGFETLVGGPVPVTREIGDGDLINLGDGGSLEVLATPGHSAGALSLRLAADRLLFSGDAVPLPGDLPVYDDFRTSLASLDRLARVDAHLLLEAWGEPAKPAKRLAEGRRWLEEIDAAVRAADRPGIDPMERCREVAAQLGLPPFAVNPLVARSLASHL